MRPAFPWLHFSPAGQPQLCPPSARPDNRKGCSLTSLAAVSQHVWPCQGALKYILFAGKASGVCSGALAVRGSGCLWHSPVAPGTPPAVPACGQGGSTHFTSALAAMAASGDLWGYGLQGSPGMLLAFPSCPPWCCAVLGVLQPAFLLRRWWESGGHGEFWL